MTRSEQPLPPAGQVAVVGLVVAGAIAGAIVATAGKTEVSLVVFTAFAGVGALLVIRRPRTSIGWILLGLGWDLVIITVRAPGTAEQFANATFDMPGDLLAVVHNGSIGLLFYLFLLLFTVFPSGRLPTGRWGRLGRVALAAGLVFVAAGCFMPFIYAEVMGHPASVVVPNPIALLPDLAIWRVFTPETVGIPVMFLVLPAALSLVVRAGRSSGTERQQLRWIAASIGFLVLAVAAGFAMASFVPGSESGLAWAPAMVAIPTVPIAIGVAVLRYRLYEIDRIISRTVAYLIVTTLLVIVFATVVVGLQSILAQFTKGQALPVAASTLLVFALFQPLRRRVQSLIDRRFDRHRYDAEQTVTTFGGRMRDDVDLDSIVGEMRSAVQSSIQPTTVAVWIRSRNESRTLEA